MKADIVIFDPSKIQDKADYANPHQYAEGVRDLIINGEPVISGGQLTKRRPGRSDQGRDGSLKRGADAFVCQLGSFSQVQRSSALASGVFVS